jgi:catalase
MSPAQRDQLLDNLAAAMTGVPEFIQLRQIGHFLKADPAYGKGVAARLGLAERIGKAAAAAE